MDQQNDFVMTHRHSLWMKLLAASVAMQQGEKPSILTYLANIFQVSITLSGLSEIE